MKRSRMSLTIAVLVLALGVATGCGSDDGGDGGGAAKSDEPITIGFVGGFTGLLSAYDTAAYNAAELAVEDINADGGVLGRQLKLIKADSQSKKGQAGAAAKKLLSQGAEFIVAPCDFDFGAAAALEAQKEEVVAISDCAGTPQFGPQGIGEYAFTMGTSGATVMTAEAEWGYEEKDWRNVYILQDDFILYHKQSCKAADEKWRSMDGAKVLGYDHFMNGDPSIATQIENIKNVQSDLDAIVLCSLPPGGVSALRQIRGAGIDLPIIAGAGFDGLYWQKAIPNLSDVYPAYYADLNLQNKDEDINDLERRLIERHGKQILQSSSNFLGGYSAVEAFARAADRSEATTGPDIVEALESFEDEDLLIGATTFTPELHLSLTRPVAIEQIQDGKTSFVTLWKPQDVPPVDSWARGE